MRKTCSNMTYSHVPFAHHLKLHIAWGKGTIRRHLLPLVKAVKKRTMRRTWTLLPFICHNPMYVQGDRRRPGASYFTHGFQKASHATSAFCKANGKEKKHLTLPSVFQRGLMKVTKGVCCHWELRK